MIKNKKDIIARQQDFNYSKKVVITEVDDDVVLAERSQNEFVSMPYVTNLNDGKGDDVFGIFGDFKVISGTDVELGVLGMSRDYDKVKASEVTIQLQGFISKDFEEILDKYIEGFSSLMETYNDLKCMYCHEDCPANGEAEDEFEDILSEVLSEMFEPENVINKISKIALKGIDGEVNHVVIKGVELGIRQVVLDEDDKVLLIPVVERERLLGNEYSLKRLIDRVDFKDLIIEEYNRGISKVNDILGGVLSKETIKEASNDLLIVGDLEVV